MKKYFLVFAILVLSLSFYTVNKTGAQVFPGTHAPVIDRLFGPSTLTVGQLGTWNIVVSDIDGDLSKIVVVWGGQSSTTVAISGTSTAVTAKHAYSAVGTFYPSFVVYDRMGNLANKINGVVVIPNMPPTISIVSGPKELEGGQTGTWVLAITDQNGDLSGVRTSWGDGTTTSISLKLGVTSTRSVLTHAYPTKVAIGGNSSPILYPIKFEVWDSSNSPYPGNKASATTSVSVLLNKPPEIVAVTGPTLLRKGYVGIWTVSALDVNSNLASIMVNWGDGSLVSSSSISGASVTKSLSHVYQVAGTKEILINVIDKLGFYDWATSTIRVTQPAPKIEPIKISASLVDSANAQISEIKSWLGVLLELLR